MVEAVPMVLQAPRPQARLRSNSAQPASSSRPARRSSHIRHSAVPVPTGRPRNWATGREPPVTRMAGISALIAPISAPGTLLSQLASSTSPSSGFARTISSTSMASKLRYSIALGFIRSSPSEMVPNSAPMPPASAMPAFTSPASSRSGRLHGFSSLAEFAMPITGRSAALLTGRPALARATRCSTATSSSPASHARLRRRGPVTGPAPGRQAPARRGRTGTAPARCGRSTPARSGRGAPSPARWRRRPRPDAGHWDTASGSCAGRT